MFKRLLFTSLLAMTAMTASSALAQQDSGMDEIETLFSSDEDAGEAARASQAPASRPPSDTNTGAEPQAKEPEFKGVSDLGRLQAFKDIAVISRRFLPKSQRFELYLAPALNLNDAFFLNFGVQGRAAYYFNERYGIEGIATLLTVTEREVTTSLKNSRDVNTTSFVTPRSYYGLDFKWVPIYGKMTWANTKITPFDLYFSGGLGLTGTNQGEYPLTFHLGSGQVFAMSKSSALRWDVSWFLFYTKSNVDRSGSTLLYNNLLFTIGWSWFFPEATYR